MPAWRPSKITKWVVAFEKVINEPMNSLLCTDEDLVFLVNERLDEWEKIDLTSFQNWKAWKLSDEYADVYKEFLCLYKKALMAERQSLMIKFQWEEGQWQKWAWIIERKFDEWNIRIKSEVKGENKNINVNTDISHMSPEDMNEYLRKIVS